MAEILLPHPGRNDDHRFSIPLQPALDGIGGFVMQKTVIPPFLLENHLGGEVRRLWKGLGDVQAKFFGFFDGVRADGHPVGCRDAQFLRQFHIFQECRLRFFLQGFNCFASLERAGVDNPDGKENEIFKMTGKSPKDIVEEKGWKQVSDTSFIEEVVSNVLKANPQSVEDFKNGKDKALAFLVGQVMKETKGQANPQIVNEILRKHM